MNTDYKNKLRCKTTGNSKLGRKYCAKVLNETKKEGHDAKKRLFSPTNTNLICKELLTNEEYLESSKTPNWFSTTKINKENFCKSLGKEFKYRSNYNAILESNKRKNTPKSHVKRLQVSPTSVLTPVHIRFQRQIVQQNKEKCSPYFSDVTKINSGGTTNLILKDTDEFEEIKFTLLPKNKLNLSNLKKKKLNNQREENLSKNGKLASTIKRIKENTENIESNENKIKNLLNEINNLYEINVSLRKLVTADLQKLELKTDFENTKLKKSLRNSINDSSFNNGVEKVAEISNKVSSIRKWKTCYTPRSLSKKLIEQEHELFGS